MDSKQTELITEEFVIQGLLKEVLRAESIFTIEGLGAEFKIVDLMESKIRDSSQNKKVLVRLLNSETFPEGVCTVRGGFYRSLLQFETIVIEGAGPKLFWVEVPKLLTLFNYRTSDRSPVKPSLRKACPILMVTNGVHCEGTFTIEDTSLEGIGGILQVPTGFPCGPTTAVRGRLYLSEGELELNGFLIRVNAVDEIKFGYDAYSVGIKQTVPEERAKGLETRTHARYKIRHEVSLVPLIHPDHTFKVDLVDISISGFSGFLIAGSVLPAFPIGTVFKFPGKSAKIVLTNFSEDIYRFQIISRSESEAIEWLRTMTPVLYPGAQCSISDARDLYKIFLQAGAISTQYLKRHELYDDSLVNEHSNIEDESGYLHRWYVRGKDKSVEAHISAIRVSNNCWFIGDLAKVSDSVIVGESLVISFFKSFSMLISECVPVPSIMGMWTIHHPLWQKWEVILKRMPDEVISCVRLTYFRTANIAVDSTIQVTLKEISPKEFSTIGRIVSAISDHQVRQFFSTVLDFDSKSFGSQNLKNIMPGFKRTYSQISFNQKHFIVVITVYAGGSSVNRVMDAVYATQFYGEPPTPQEELQLVSYIGTIASSAGAVVPSIRYISSFDRDHTSSGQQMKCYVLTPRGYSSFEGFT